MGKWEDFKCGAFLIQSICFVGWHNQAPVLWHSVDQGGPELFFASEKRISGHGNGLRQAKHFQKCRGDVGQNSVGQTVLVRVGGHVKAVD